MSSCMRSWTSRRALPSLAAGLTIGSFLPADRPALAEAPFGQALSGTVGTLERRSGGRLGVSVTDLSTGRGWSHRGAERFPMTSTFKAFLCAHLLSLADRGWIDPEHRVRFGENELESYSPVTREHAGGEGLSLLELCAATTATSDNTAANLVLRHTGGPEALTLFMRSIGDGITRLDRDEPALNEVGPGDERDTTTPDAAAASLRTLLLGDALSPRSRRQLDTWLVGNRVGGPLLRASLPQGWRIADRTGSGAFGSRGIVALIWPRVDGAPAQGPVSVSVYLTGTALSLEERNQVVAEVGTALVRDLTP